MGCYGEPFCLDLSISENPNAQIENPNAQIGEALQAARERQQTEAFNLKRALAWLSGELRSGTYRLHFARLELAA